MTIDHLDKELIPIVEVKKVEKTSYNFFDPVIDLLAGSAGGAACVFVGQPLDTVKVKMQTFPELYSNSFFCIKQTLLKENVRGLYAGTVPALVANIAENSVLFCAYGVCQSFVKLLARKEKIEHLSPFENACSGFLAAFFSSFTLCPTELIKCRLQAMREVELISGQRKSAIGPWGLTKEILRKEGILGLYHGLVPTFLREMPGYFCFFGGYELSRVLLTPPGKTKEELGAVRTIISGGVGGAALWLSIFPFDVVKSRMQVTGTKENMWKIMTDIHRKEGFTTLYKGLGPTLIRTFPATGALFLAYEYTKKLCYYAINNS